MKTRRTHIAIACTLANCIALSLPAQFARSEARGGKGPEVWRLTIQPQAPGRPALRHALLPPVAEQSPGNAAPIYLLAFFSVQEIPRTPMDPESLANKGLPPAENDDLLHYYLQGLPLEKLPLEDVESFLRPYQTAFQFFDTAVQREYCRWHLPTRTQGFETLLPHLNASRQLANAAALRVRVHLARGDFAQATDALSGLFKMSRDLTEEGLLIQSLVATSIASIGARSAREIIQQPGAPNLYWPLASLPSPFVDFGLAMEWERTALMGTFPQLKKAGTEAFTAVDWRDFVNGQSRLAIISGSRHPVVPPVGQILGPAAAGVVLYPQAKKYLRARGMTEKQLEETPVAEVLGRYVIEQYNQWFDEMLKWTALPAWQGYTGMARAEQEFAQTSANVAVPSLFAAVPAVSRALLQRGRLDRQIAALQTIEAMRAYAAAHDDKLPARLEDLGDETPAPIDPTTGKLFVYRVEGNKATLESPAPPGDTPRGGLRVELTLK